MPYGRYSGGKRSYNAGVAAGMQKAKKRKYGGGTQMTGPQRGYLRQSGYYGRRGARLAGFAVERKFFDTNVGTSIGTVANSLEIRELAIVPQGDTESERIGRKIQIKSLDVKGHLLLNASTTSAATSTMVRMLVVQDKQTNGAVFTATDLLEADNWISFNNLANSSRFRVLHSQEFQLVAKAGASVASPAVNFGEDVVPVHAHLDLDMPIEYDNSATSGVITSVRSNNLYICFIAVADLVSTFAGMARIRFTDR